MFYERHLVHRVVRNARIEMLQHTPDWEQIGEVDRDVQIFVALLEEVAKDLPGGENI